MNFKTPKIRSEKHLAYVRRQACIISGHKGESVIAHHLLRAGGKGMGTKACDSLTVPLTTLIHDALHKNGNEESFFANHGLNYEVVKALAMQFASLSPDKRIREAMRLWELNNEL